MKILLVTTELQKKELGQEHDDFIKKLGFDNVNTKGMQLSKERIGHDLYHITIEEASGISRETADKYDIIIYLGNRKVIEWFKKKVRSVKGLDGKFTTDFINGIRCFKNKRGQLTYIGNSILRYKEKFKENWSEILYFLVRGPVLESQIRLSKEFSRGMLEIEKTIGGYSFQEVIDCVNEKGLGIDTSILMTEESDYDYVGNIMKCSYNEETLLSFYKFKKESSQRK